MKRDISKKTVFSASIWTIGGFIVSQLLRFSGNLILTRLLLPEYFGVMGIVSVIFVGLAMFSDLGLLQSVVQSRKGETPIFLNTVWTIQIIRGVILSLVILGISAVIQFCIDTGLLTKSSVYGDELLPKVLLILSIIPLINGFESTKIFVANRRLNLKPIMILEITTQIVALLVMILLALYSPTIWSLVAGVLVSALLKTILSHALMDGVKNTVTLDRGAVREVVSFGKWVMLASISGFLLSQGDRLLLGGLINAEVLGVYAIAYFLANSVLMGLTKLNQTVFFPALSDVAREQGHRLGEYYYRIRTKTDILVLLVAGALFISGESIINLLYDDRYSEAGWMLEVLGISVLGVGSVVAEQIFLATGNSKWLSVTSFSQLLFLYVGVPIAYYYLGLYGAVWIIAVAFLPKYVISLYFLKKLQILSLVKEVRFLPVLLIGFALGYMMDVALLKIA